MTSPSTRWYSGLAIGGLVFLIAQAIMAQVVQPGYRESINLLTWRQLQQGLVAYSQVFTLESPLFVALLQGLPTTPGLVMPLFGLGTLLLTADIGRRLGGPRLSLITLGLMVLAVTNLVYADAVLALTPALFLGMLALGAGLRFNHGHGGEPWGYLLVSGVGYATAVLLAPEMLPLGLIIWLWPRQNTPQPQFRRNVGLWAAVATATALLWWGFHQAAFAQHIAHWRQIWQSLPPAPGYNFAVLGQFLTLNGLLSLLALVALTRSQSENDSGSWWIFIWLFSSAVMVILLPQPDLAQTMGLLPPLALLAGKGLLHTGDTLAGLVKTPLQRRATFSVAIATALLLTGHQWLALAYRDVDTENDLHQFRQRPAMTAFIQARTPPEACALADDPALLVAAHRLPPPWLNDLSPRRVESGLLSQAALQDHAVAAACPTVVFYKRNLHQHLDDFKGWVENTYPNEQNYPGTQIFYRPE